jgi:hypothetical protein
MPISIDPCVCKREPVRWPQQHDGIREYGLLAVNSWDKWRSGPNQSRALVANDFRNANNLEA